MAPLPVSTTKCRRPARMYLPRIRSCALPAVRIDLDPMGSDDTADFEVQMWSEAAGCDPVERRAKLRRPLSLEDDAIRNRQERRPGWQGPVVTGVAILPAGSRSAKRQHIAVGIRGLVERDRQIVVEVSRHGEVPVERTLQPRQHRSPGPRRGIADGV